MLLRNEVKWFSRKMESTLRENDHKGGWHDDDIWWLYSRAVGELSEVGVAISAIPADVDDEDIIRECTDVANFMMMIADRVAKGNL